MTQAEALQVLKTGANVFLTGEPGSGKTHTVNAFVEWLRASGVEPSITAATGIAAAHVGGMTLHAWSGIGVASSLSPVDIDRIANREPVARRIGKAKVLIVDEISMLSAATLEMVDAVCREVRRSERPFGGLTVVLVGDFFQLPPVSRGNEVAFCYESPVWRELNHIVCYLTEQFRQDDTDFLDMLSSMRAGHVGQHHRERLTGRHTNTTPRNAPRLFSHNADVNRINAEELARLPGNTHTFSMTSKGRETVVEGLKRGCLSPERLELKDGAAVMFTKNSPQGAFVNGTLGVVIGWGSDGLPVVRIAGGKSITVEPAEWRVEEQVVVRASVTQVPLRLAYAMTVHKSQGMSMDAAVMDLSRAFEYGQGYVALSRVRRLTGVHLVGFNTRALEVHPEVLKKDRTFRAASETARDTFAEMTEGQTSELQKKFITAMGGAWINEKEMREKRARGSSASSAFPPRLAETLQAVRDGVILSAVAKKRSLSQSTIVRHLEELSELGRLQPHDFSHLLPPKGEMQKIVAALAAERSNKLAPVFHALKSKYSFETIRLVRIIRQLDG